MSVVVAGDVVADVVVADVVVAVVAVSFAAVAVGNRRGTCVSLAVRGSPVLD